MRSVMRLRGPQQAPVLLSAPHINTVGFHGDPAHLLCTNHLQSSTSVPCQFYIPPYFTAHLKSQKSEVVQVLLDTDSKLVSNPLATAADPPISTTLVAMELSTPQGKPIAVQHLDPEQAIRVTLPKKGPAGQDSGSTEWKEGKTGNETCLTVSLPTEGSLNFTIAAVGRLVENTGLYISFNFSLDAGKAFFSPLLSFPSVPTLHHKSFTKDTYTVFIMLIILSVSGESKASFVKVNIVTQTSSPLSNMFVRFKSRFRSSSGRVGTFQLKEAQLQLLMQNICVFTAFNQDFPPSCINYTSEWMIFFHYNMHIKKLPL